MLCGNHMVSCRSMAKALSPMMTLRDFENGYWYLDQLKNFAERIGIPAAKKLRKDELEKAIVAFLRTGNAALPMKRSLRKTGVKDVERGLNLKLRIENKELDVPKDYVSWVKALARVRAGLNAAKVNTVHLTHEMNFLATDYADLAD